MQRVKAICAPRSGEPRPPGRRVLRHLRAATGLARPLPLPRASRPLHSLDPVEVSGSVGPGSAGLRKPRSGPGSRTPAGALAGASGRGARVPLLAAARGQGVRGDRAPRRGQRQRPGSQLRRGTKHAGASFRSCSAGPRGWGARGCRAQRPAGGRGGGGPRELGRSGRRARGRVGMDNQHLGRNSSRRFPPSVSEGSETGPCEPEGGSERRVCARAGRRGDSESTSPPARETQPGGGNGAERIIKAGKRGWERRGVVWGGGFTRPGSYYTGLGASASFSIPQTRAQTGRPCAPPGRASRGRRAPRRCA